MMPKLGMKCRSIPLAANENIKNFGMIVLLELERVPNAAASHPIIKFHYDYRTRVWIGMDMTMTI